MFTNKLQTYITTIITNELLEIANKLLLEIETRRQPDNGIKTMAGVTSLIEFLATAPIPHPLPRDISPKNLSLCLDVHPEEIARQLALIGINNK